MEPLMRPLNVTIDETLMEPLIKTLDGALIILMELMVYEG